MLLSNTKPNQCVKASKSRKQYENKIVNRARADERGRAGLSGIGWCEGCIINKYDARARPVYEAAHSLYLIDNIRFRRESLHLDTTLAGVPPFRSKIPNCKLLLHVLSPFLQNIQYTYKEAYTELLYTNYSVLQNCFVS